MRDRRHRAARRRRGSVTLEDASCAAPARPLRQRTRSFRRRGDRRCDFTIHRSQTEAARLGFLVGTAIETIEDRTALDLRHARAFVLDPGRDACRRRASAPTRTTLSSGANLLALASRLTNTCVRRGPSPSTRGRSSGNVQRRSVWRRCFSSAPISASASSTHLSDRDALMADAELARFDAHALEQVVDQPRQAQRAALERQHQLLLLFAAASCPGLRAATRSRRAARRAACGTRARCWRAPSRAHDARLRARSRRE